MRDALQVLQRLRQEAVKQAARELAAAQAAQQQQLGRLERHRLLIAQERAAADGPGMAAWYPYARAQQQTLATELTHHEVRSTQQREHLTLQRLAAQAVAKALTHRDSLAAVQRARRDQSVMDEAAARAGGRSVLVRET
jgi:flagellar biosynthesis chaperone FliJ